MCDGADLAHTAINQLYPTHCNTVEDARTIINAIDARVCGLEHENAPVGTQLHEVIRIGRRYLRLNRELGQARTGRRNLVDAPYG